MSISNLKLNLTAWQLGLKFIAITLLTLLMLIPKFMIVDLVNERARLNDDVNEDVASSWAKDQLISGPYLTIPYYKETLTDQKVWVKEKNYFTLLPDNLKIEGAVQTTSRNRSLYKVLLYETGLNLSGNFSTKDFHDQKINPNNILWSEANLSLNISDPKGIKEEVILLSAENKIKMLPGLNELQIIANKEFTEKAIDKSKNRILRVNDGTNTGLHCQVQLNSVTQAYPFEIPLNLKGSRGLLFAPTAKTTSVNINSRFNDPSFIGEYLPEHNLSDSGFVAHWNILEYNKTLPNFFNETRTISLENSVFGINIQNPVNHYSKTGRACKYIILFIIVIFLSLFITEIYHQIKVHIFQYGLIGLAIVIFFAMLLSFSEFISFNSSYGLAFLAVTILIFLYSRSVFNNRNSSYFLTGLVVTFFTFIFIIIQLEKTALLFGTLMLFVILALTMFMTRKIKWYEDQYIKDEEKIIY